MKRITQFLTALVLLVLAASGPVLAQTTDVPRIISYQGVVHGSDNQTLNGNHRVSVAFYGDKEGKNLIWQGTYDVPIEGGVFNVLLGSGASPLPEAKTMSQTLFVGVSLDNGPEMRPFSMLAGVPYAITVPDRSITKEKIGADYVGSISVNGKKITAKGSTLNLTNGENSWLSYDEKTGNLSLNSLGNIGNAKPQSATWNLAGNSTTTPGTDYLGTTDNNALEVRVNNGYTAAGAGAGRVMKYFPESNSPSYLGGYRGNTMGTVNGSAIVAGGDSLDVNDQQGSFSLIGTGIGNSVSADSAVILSGSCNSVSGVHSMVLGGGTKGHGNSVAGENSTITGGLDNSIAGHFGAIGGGVNNAVSDSFSVILGGRNLKLGKNSVGFSAYTGGVVGIPGVTQVDRSSLDNLVYFSNMNALWLASDDSHAAELRLGQDLGYLYYTSFKCQGQVDYIHYDLPALQAPSDPLAPAHTIKKSVLINSVDNTTPAYGTWSWGSAGDLGDVGAWDILGNNGTDPVSGLNFLGTKDNHAFEIHVYDGDAANQGSKRVMRYEPNATSANVLGGFQGNIITSLGYGNTIAGGGQNGSPNKITSVLSGPLINTFGFIGGGDNNIIHYDNETVWEGLADEFVQYGDVIVGGRHNQVEDIASAIVGGENNTIHEGWGVIGGGNSNLIQGTYNGILGGVTNRANGAYDAIGGGLDNRVWGLGLGVDSWFSVIGGGEANRINTFSTPIDGYATHMTIPGGDHLLAQSYAQTVVGKYNIAQGTSSKKIQWPDPNAQTGSVVLDDRLFIIGNGVGEDDIPNNIYRRSNAFEVSTNGHSIVYDNLGNNSGTVATISTRKPIVGASYEDNLPSAWGYINTNGTIQEGFGISAATWNAGASQYEIDLDYVDPYSGAQRQMKAAATVATLVYVNGDNHCYTIFSFPIQWVGGRNRVIIRICDPANACSRVQAPFMFHVIGRPQ